jgi:nicotinate dehydrogenase subunit B
MTPLTSIPKQIEDVLENCAGTTSRRNVLQTSGLLVVSLTLANEAGAQAPAAAQAAGPYPDPNFRQLDTWIVIHEDNTATYYVGKTDGGQGTGTAFRQMMCDELDLAYDQSSLIMGNTDMTPDQGGSGGSDGIEVDGWPMRRVAAEARRVLLEMASKRFEVPVDQLAVSGGVITVKSNPSQRVTYGQLVGGKRFNVALTGENINATTGVAKVKPVQDLKIVGQSIKRYDIPGKVDGTTKWAVGAKVPGMVHARNVRPPFAGAKLISIEEASVKDIPGLIKIVSKGNYVAVVCEREENAIKAARQLKVNWEKPATPPFPTSENLYKYIREAKPTSTGQPDVVGNPDAAFGSAAKVMEADYEYPFQGHTAIAPAHGMADPSNGLMTIYTSDMKAYGHRLGIATFLGIPKEKIRVVYLEGPQQYGRTAVDDAGFEAAWLAKEIGRPVRVQWMRHEETAWDTKGPAYTVKMRGAMDAQGKLVALEYSGRAADFNHLGYNEPDSVLIAHLQGIRRATPAPGGGADPDEMYAIPNRRRTVEVVSMPLIWESPLRTGNLRDPNGPQVTFAAESFIDELAAAAKIDPVEFRMKLLTADKTDDRQFKRARSIATVNAAVKAFNWDSRPSPKPIGNGKILTGRGFAYTYRGQTVVAEIAEVEVNRETGQVWVKRLVCAHDCGLVINPEGVKRTVEGNLLNGLSRAMWEEVRFDTEKVTSVDWITHPTMTHADCPAQIDVIIVNGDPNPNRPDLPHYGAGEASIKPTGAAIANAIFDATGVRIRRVPFRKERVLAALKTARLA